MRLGRPGPPLTGAYALDSLTGLELDRFERHLPHCPACDHEVRDFRETAAPGGRGGRHTARAVPAPGAAGGLGHPPGTTADPGRGPALSSRPVPAARWLAAAVAAVAIAAAVALGIVESVTQHQLNRAQAQIHSAAAVLAAPDARLTESGPPRPAGRPPWSPPSPGTP